MTDFAFNSADFTEARYCEVLELLRARFRVVPISQAETGGRIAILRHDIDISPHRALKLAKLEAELGLFSVWYVHLGSAFYNPFEPGIISLVREIAAHGHEIGLHFDAAECRSAALSAVEDELRFEAEVLSRLVDKPVTSFSLHNPTVPSGVKLDEAWHGGLLNASATSLCSRFSYCSDSNGIWRFRPLHEVICDPDTSRLYALTHPVWWSVEEMTPWQRVQRAVDGRAKSVLKAYDDLLTMHSRPNIR